MRLIPKQARRASLICGVVAVLLVGCSHESQEIDPNANEVDTKLLTPAQGHLAPGVVVYDVDGVKVGRVIKVDPDYTFSSGTRGAVFMDYDDPKEEDSYRAMAWFDNAFVRP